MTDRKKTARTGQLIQDSQSGTVRMDRQDRTARTKLPGQDCQDRAARTRCQHGTARIRQPGQERQEDSQNSLHFSFFYKTAAYIYISVSICIYTYIFTNIGTENGSFRLLQTGNRKRQFGFPWAENDKQ
jgi:hypothetical protein